MNEFLKENKTLIITAVAIIAGIIILFTMGGESNNQVSGEAKVDNSKAVTTSQDKLDNGAVKMGNIGSVGGNVDLSRHETSDNSKK